MDFFKTVCQEPPRTDILFGICDDNNGFKAYTKTTEKNSWIATVSNNSKKTVIFTAIDKCVISVCP